MKILIFSLLFSLLTLVINSQDQPDTTLNRWVPGVVAGLNISQIAFSNWTQGGENSLAWTITGKFNAMYKAEKWEFKNELKSAYGQTKIGSDLVKVTDNELFLESVFSYNIGWLVDPYFSNSLLTQIATGYDYSDDDKVEIADFFDPGYITQSIGFTYGKSKVVQSRLGLAFKETITNKFTKYSDDPETPDEIETFKFETGIESVTDLKIPLDENIAYVSKLGLFSAFDRLDVWDVRWDNLITAKINKWLNVNLTYLLIYDKVQSPTAQMKQGLQLGITYTIL